MHALWRGVARAYVSSQGGEVKELGEHIKTWHERFKLVKPSIPTSHSSILMTILHYRVHWWYLDKDGNILEYVDYERAQLGYTGSIGRGDLYIGGSEHSTIIPRRRVLQVQIDQISEAEFWASKEQPQ